MINNENEEEEKIPLYMAEKIAMYQNFANQRAHKTTAIVCVTFILITIIFVVGYTVREKNWLNTIQHINAPAITEVADEVQQNANH
jgi:preprotein translocase subunit SecG